MGGVDDEEDGGWKAIVDGAVAEGEVEFFGQEGEAEHPEEVDVGGGCEAEGGEAPGGLGE